MTDKLITNSSDTDKVLIEKARELADDNQIFADVKRECFIDGAIAGATWQYENTRNTSQSELESRYNALNDEVTRSHTRCVELEAEINQRDNEIKTIRAISNGMLKENEKLKKELDEVTEIIKDEICKVWEKGCERRERAKQFLSSLDKPKEEK